MRENEKEREELKASHLKTLLMEKIRFLQCFVWGFYSQTPFTNYQNNKTNTITMGANREDKQKVTKIQKVKSKMNSGRKAISQPCEISQGSLLVLPFSTLIPNDFFIL